MKLPRPDRINLLLTPTNWLVMIGMSPVITMGQSFVAARPQELNDNLKKVYGRTTYAPRTAATAKS